MAEESVPSKAPENFRDLVYNMVRQIPFARVASYGQVADLVGYPKHSRLVGSVLKVREHYAESSQHDSQNQTLTDETIPWHRVVNGKGGISPRSAGPLASERQIERLRAENITVETFGHLDPGKVDMLQYGWEGPA